MERWLWLWLQRRRSASDPCHNRGRTPVAAAAAVVSRTYTYRQWTVRRFSCRGLFAESFQITRSHYSHFVCLESFLRLVDKKIQ
jgi:hypothetical protein